MRLKRFNTSIQDWRWTKPVFVFFFTDQFQMEIEAFEHFYARLTMNKTSICVFKEKFQVEFEAFQHFYAKLTMDKASICVTHQTYDWKI